jgi:hypothetical protein
MVRIDVIDARGECRTPDGRSQASRWAIENDDDSVESWVLSATGATRCVRGQRGKVRTVDRRGERYGDGGMDQPARAEDCESTSRIGSQLIV